MKITVNVLPNSSRNEIIGPDEKGEYKVKVQSPPVEGSANKNLIKLISSHYGVSKSKVRIASGETSRRKVLEIDGCEDISI
jgi:uncharacterized protein